MGLPLPLGELMFLTPAEAQPIIDEFMLHRGSHFDPDHDEYGYVIEATIFFPPHKADFFASFPPLAIPRKVVSDELSPHTRDLAAMYGMSTNRPTTKLVSDLSEKCNYILHYRYLRSVLFLGAELRSIRRVLRFKQAAWLAPYIEGNTRMRTLATSESERNFWKLMNNCVYGKTMENVR